MPDEVYAAHRYLVETLEFRRDGLARIADDLPNALGDESRRRGLGGRRRQMQVFLASDVIYARRFTPSLAEALKDEDLTGGDASRPAPSCRTSSGCSPTKVADAITGLRTGSSGDDQASGGLHGNGLGGRGARRRRRWCRATR